jgi:hypothetical protein
MSVRLSLNVVMAGLDPAIHVFAAKKDVDHRDKPGDDQERSI